MKIKFNLIIILLQRRPMPMYKSPRPLYYSESPSMRSPSQSTRSPRHIINVGFKKNINNVGILSKY